MPDTYDEDIGDDGVRSTSTFFLVAAVVMLVVGLVGTFIGVAELRSAHHEYAVIFAACGVVVSVLGAAGLAFCGYAFRVLADI